MARPLRIDLTDGLYHVTARGWERRLIFGTDRDREDWLRLLDRVATRCNWLVFSWVLMGNHYHLLVRTPNANLSIGMHDLNSGYASLFNRRYRRSGALFQGRFKAIVVEQESHALELTRYIHLNPVRAGIVHLPEHYRWSSYVAYRFPRVGSEAPPWLDWRTVLAELSYDERVARRTYRRFIESGITGSLKSPVKAVVGGVFLGSPAWIEDRRKELARCPREKDVPQRRLLTWRPDKETVVQAVCNRFGVDVRTLHQSRRHHNDARIAALYLLRSLTDMKVADLAAEFGGVSSAAICKILSRAERRRDQDPQWAALLQRLAEKCQMAFTGNKRQD